MKKLEEKDLAMIPKKPKPTTMTQALQKVAPTDIGKVVSNSLYYYGNEPVQTDEECEQRLIDFFTHIVQTGDVPTVEKMSLCLGVTPQAVCKWENGAKGHKRAEIIQQAKTVLASLDAELAVTGKMPAVPYIFRAKNYYGMRDQSEYIVTPNNAMGDVMDADSLVEEAELLPD